jgi:hypothetical protein
MTDGRAGRGLEMNCLNELPRLYPRIFETFLRVKKLSGIEEWKWK